MTTTAPLAVPPAPPAEAAAYFAARLAFHTDVADVHAALATGAPGFVLVDTRSRAAWDQGHVPGAVHLPTAELPGGLDPSVPVVVHCWGPGCDGATRAALALARAGVRVKEMLGGFEYWAREGLPVESAAGLRLPDPDPLTVPCGC
ncbi:MULTISPECIES: rhodanese-like domain-containing protein [Pseudonocardia]|uniref:Rhodanese-related sulfurtransferase n=1 Tax=Pseudonocardia oroxyli TaxID=366584 RepID=A0A1G7HZN7_PSEOR|nr:MULTISPECIES: rhodanese-like domain-containing protein [Pseudonocardia]MCF7549090.1 rhodanese-like domain-containing protein [Pseudonocardia sp. WMMC193]SDF05619.1 Rhodanese-related sulfurtransferase [Pseudonocardia oroxyli]